MKAFGGERKNISKAVWMLSCKLFMADGLVSLFVLSNVSIHVLTLKAIHQVFFSFKFSFSLLILGPQIIICLHCLKIYNEIH